MATVWDFNPYARQLAGTSPHTSTVLSTGLRGGAKIYVNLFTDYFYRSVITQFNDGRWCSGFFVLAQIYNIVDTF